MKIEQHPLKNYLSADDESLTPLEAARVVLSRVEQDLEDPPPTIVDSMAYFLTDDKEGFETVKFRRPADELPEVSKMRKEFISWGLGTMIDNFGRGYILDYYFAPVQDMLIGVNSILSVLDRTMKELSKADEKLDKVKEELEETQMKLDQYEEFDPCKNEV